MINGTGSRACVGAVPVAGKTGTAQKAVQGKGYVDGKYVSSFAGFFPADSPIKSEGDFEIKKGGEISY